MTKLADRKKKEKYEFTFMTEVEIWGYITDDYVIVDNQFPILEHYKEKHYLSNRNNKTGNNVLNQ